MHSAPNFIDLHIVGYVRNFCVYQTVVDSVGLGYKVKFHFDLSGDSTPLKKDPVNGNLSNNNHRFIDRYIDPARRDARNRPKLSTRLPPYKHGDDYIFIPKKG